MPNLVKRQPLDVYAHLNGIANQAAILLNIDDAILTDWFNRQCGWWMTHAKKLTAAKQTPEIAARLAHATETIALLRKRQHVLVCRRHGVQGISEGEWYELIGKRQGDRVWVPALYVALANRGIFDLPEGGNYGEWERDCELCLRSVFKGVSEAPRLEVKDEKAKRDAAGDAAVRSGAGQQHVRVLREGSVHSGPRGASGQSRTQREGEHGGLLHELQQQEEPLDGGEVASCGIPPPAHQGRGFGVDRLGRPPQSLTRPESAPVKPQGTLRCSQCRAMTDAVAKGLNDSLCANCWKAWRPRNARY